MCLVVQYYMPLLTERITPGVRELLSGAATEGRPYNLSTLPAPSQLWFGLMRSSIVGVS